ncbi:MAG: tyrosine-type recombinase/integrase [Verrucomicrobiales bacterium]|nr:tyrosine-type recombinase/integrase [Verrucomicrobiales bacterium]
MAKVARLNQKSGQEVAKVKPANRFAKSDVRYWLERIFKKTYRVDGDLVEAHDFSARIAFKGRRERFNLLTANKAQAATKAREIYLCLVSKGWEETLLKYKPSVEKTSPEPIQEPEEEKPPVTVGEFLRAAAEVASVAPRTLSDYTLAFRRLVADIHKVPNTKARYDYVNGGREEWLAQVDCHRLDSISPGQVQKWKLAYLRKAGANPAKIASAKTTANAMLQRCKSLFSERKVLRYVREQLELPSPLPFDGVDAFEQQRALYHSKVDFEMIVRLAHAELGGSKQSGEKLAAYRSRIEQYKIFLLAIFAGLRRAEIDALTWKQMELDGDAPCILIEATESMRLKRGSSGGTVSIDHQLARLFSDFQEQSMSKFVIESNLRPRPSASYAYYRAATHYKGLLKWLREKGIEDQKPLHVLRKEAGSFINDKKGLIAAQRFLRHTDPRTTARHYLDTKERVTVTVGDLLGG